MKKLKGINYSTLFSNFRTFILRSVVPKAVHSSVDWVCFADVIGLRTVRFSQLFRPTLLPSFIHSTKFWVNVGQPTLF